MVKSKLKNDDYEETGEKEEQQQQQEENGDGYECLLYIG